MSHISARNSPSRALAVAARFAGFLLFWQILVGWPVHPLDTMAELVLGVILAGIATGLSLHLLPGGMFRIHPGGLVQLTVRFASSSFAAGLDIARAAFSRSMPLQPGMVTHDSSLQPGPLRDAFLSMTSLTPGTLAIDANAEGKLLYHALDTSQPVQSALADDERLLTKAIAPRDVLLTRSRPKAAPAS